MPKKYEYQMVYVDWSYFREDPDGLSSAQAAAIREYLTEKIAETYPNATIEIVNESEVGSIVAARNYSVYRQIPGSWYQDAYDATNDIYAADQPG